MLNVIFLSIILFFSENQKSPDYNFAARCGPVFYADNSGYSGPGSAPEIISIVISDGTTTDTYQVCCGNDGYLEQWSTPGSFTIKVYVESDWGGGSGKVGLRYYNGTVIDCAPYVYGKGLYTFTISNSACDSFELFSDNGSC